VVRPEGATASVRIGHGLSYTNFSYGDLRVTGDDVVTATFTVTNTGEMSGADVPQLYLTAAAGDRRMRLLGFERVELAPGESRQVTIATDPRLLARFDGDAAEWHVAGGTYEIALARAADDWVMTAGTTVADRRFGR